MLSRTPGRCTFTATVSPLRRRTPRYTCTSMTTQVHTQLICTVKSNSARVCLPTYAHLNIYMYGKGQWFCYPAGMPQMLPCLKETPHSQLQKHITFPSTYAKSHTPSLCWTTAFQFLSPYAKYVCKLMRQAGPTCKAPQEHSQAAEDQRALCSGPTITIHLSPQGPISQAAATAQGGAQQWG